MHRVYGELSPRQWMAAHTQDEIDAIGGRRLSEGSSADREVGYCQRHWAVTDIQIQRTLMGQLADSFFDS